MRHIRPSRALLAVGLATAGLVAASSGVAGVSPANGGSTLGPAAHRPPTRTIHVIAELAVGDEVDLGVPGRSVGDQFVFGGRLVSPGADGEPVGRIGGNCVVTDLELNAGLCTMTAVLPNGQLSVQGEQEGIPTPRDVANAIVGGTGAFQTARGELVQRFVTPATWDLTFRVFQRP